jgi:predicted aspartyl protease
MQTTAGVLFLAAGLSAAVSAAASDRCQSVLRVDVPITFAEGVPIIRLQVNHKEAALVLDTGAESTIVSTSAADRLQLPRSMVYPRRLQGLGGGVVAGMVDLPDLAIGGVHFPNFGALVAPVDLPKLDGVVPDGLLGADILSDFEVDLDFAHSRVRLFCAVGAPDWGTPYTVIDANRSVHDRLFFRATLDGKKVATIIDTGAQNSVIDTRFALAAGANPQVLSREPAKAVRGVSGGAGTPARPYRFRQLVIGDETLANPILLVAPLGLEDADLIVGADLLRDRRVRLSYRSHRIFLRVHDDTSN